MMKILIIGNIYFGLPDVLRNSDSVKVIPFIKKTNLFKRLFKGLCIRLKLKQQLNYYTIDECACAAKDFDAVILFDGAPDAVLSHYMSSIEQNVDLTSTKLFLYFWNSRQTLKNLTISEHWNPATFDKLDAVRFSLKYVGGFYNAADPPLIHEADDAEVFFVGRDKGRFKYIRSLEQQMNDNGISTKFVYVDPVRGLFLKKNSPYIPYSLIVRHIKRCKAILDITNDYQYGLSLRFYEGLFYNRKIITNHSRIKEYKFYDSNRIFVLTEDTTPSQIANFLKSEITQASEEILEAYSCEAWLDRMLLSDHTFNDTIRS